MDRISAWFQKPPTEFTCSAKSARGRKQLLGVIDEAMTAIKAERSQATISEDAAPSETAPRPQSPLVTGRKSKE